MALIGGAVLARYMLPAVPLVIIVGVSTLRTTLALLARGRSLVALSHSSSRGSGILPTDSRPKTIWPIATYIVLHQDGERFLEARYPMAHVLTAWPAIGRTDAPLARLRHAADAGRAHRGFLAR